jgi:YD repeat-containing protein
MNSRRSTFTFAARLIPMFFLLLFVAPHSPAQQDKGPSSEPSSAPKASSNPRPAAGQTRTTPRGNNKSDTGATKQHGPSANAPGRSGSSTDAADGRGPSTNGPGRRGTSNNIPGRPGSSTDAADGRSPSTNGPGRRGPRGNPAGQPGETTTGDRKNASGSGQPNSTKGGLSRTTRANGRVIERGKDGRTTSVTTPRGTTARMDGRGRVTSIRDRSGNTISRGPRGERRVETVRADRSRVVSIGRRGGYVERGFDRGGRQYVRRTYVVGGHTYVNVYRGYHYHGVRYYWYVPPFYYAPAYYRWIYNPWPRPIYYSWDWYGSPWYRPYRYYFSPYSAYPYASLWLTDYLLAENLRLAYEADATEGYQPGDNEVGIALAAYHPSEQMNANQPKSDSVLLTPEVKQMIADEVRTVIADEQKAASSSSNSMQAGSGEELPAALDPNHRVFVVFSVVEATKNGETCSLTSSDVVKRTEDAPDVGNTIAVRILASKKSDCAMGSTARVQLTDLNDMQNHLHEQVDAGIKTLSEKQGKGGLPSAPVANPRAVPEGTAAPDATAAADLKEQEREADQTEKELEPEVSSDSGAAN